MSKASVSCPSCSAENDPDAEFCIECGSKLMETKSTNSELTDDEKWQKEYRDWKRSVPFTTAAAVFLYFIDLITSPGIQWAHWPAVPIILFAVIAPYFSFKMK